MRTGRSWDCWFCRCWACREYQCRGAEGAAGAGGAGSAGSVMGARGAGVTVEATGGEAGRPSQIAGGLAVWLSWAPSHLGRWADLHAATIRDPSNQGLSLRTSWRDLCPPGAEGSKGPESGSVDPEANRFLLPSGSAILRGVFRVPGVEGPAAPGSCSYIGD